MYGQQLKAPAAMVRLRLYETLLVLPPQSFEGTSSVNTSMMFYNVFSRFLYSFTADVSCRVHSGRKSSEYHNFPASCSVSRR